MKAVRVTPLMKKAQAVRRKRRRKNKRIQMRRTPVQQVCSLTQFYCFGSKDRCKKYGFFYKNKIIVCVICLYGVLGPATSSITHLTLSFYL